MVDKWYGWQIIWLTNDMVEKWYGWQMVWMTNGMVDKWYGGKMVSLTNVMVDKWYCWQMVLWTELWTYHGLEGYPWPPVVPHVPDVDGAVPRRRAQQGRVQPVPAQVRYLPEGSTSGLTSVKLMSRSRKNQQKLQAEVLYIKRNIKKVIVYDVLYKCIMPRVGRR